jgi:WD40 repeat protein
VSGLIARQKKGSVMTIASVFLAVLMSAGTVTKNPVRLSRLPPCARFCEWLDSQAETGSFYDGIPETGDTRDTHTDPEATLNLPFGYPDSVSAILEGISGPLSISVSPSGLYIYVIGSDEDGIMILRTSNLETVGSISISDSSSTEDASLSEYDERDAAVHWPRVAVCVHPRGGYIYVADEADGTVSVFRIDDGVLVGRMKVGDSPTDITFNPAGDRAFVTCYDSNQIYVLE